YAFTMESGERLYNENKPDLAIAQADKILSKVPNDPVASDLKNRAEALKKNNDYTDQLRDFRRLATTGHDALKAGNWPEATNLLSQAVEKGRALNELQSLGAVQTDLEAATIRDRGPRFFTNGQPKSAIEQADKVLGRYPADPLALDLKKRSEVLQLTQTSTAARSAMERTNWVEATNLLAQVV